MLANHDCCFRRRRHKKNCRICQSSLVFIKNIASTPLEDLYTRKPNKPRYWPLDLMFCKRCSLLQLGTLIPPVKHYSDYLYQTKTTQGLLTHYDKYAENLAQKLKLNSQSLVLDIGSNDGSFLSCFKKRGIRVLGVEPAPAPAKEARRRGIPTLGSFLSRNLARHINSLYGQPDLITANYMFANVRNLKSFLACVAELMRPSSMFVIQTGYHPEQWKKLMFDYIYHEHYYYFTLSSLQKILALFSMNVIHVQLVGPKGGSLRLYIKKNGRDAITESVQKIYMQEKRQKINEKLFYLKFFKKLQSQKQKLLRAIQKLRKKHLRIVGFGASHSTTTFLCYFKMAPYLDYIVDDNKLKHERYSPGTNLKIFPPRKLYQDKPDFVLVLGWQHAETIVSRHKKFLRAGRKFLVPLPRLKIYS